MDKFMKSHGTGEPWAHSPPEPDEGPPEEEVASYVGITEEEYDALTDDEREEHIRDYIYECEARRAEDQWEARQDYD
jgi:hypothetical protein